MRRQKLLPLLLLAQLAAAESLPLISNEAKHCLKPDICATVSVTSINSSDPALNKFADGLLNSATDAETAELYSFDKLDQAGLEAWIKRIAPVELNAGKVTDNNDYSFNYSVIQVGETTHYRVLRRGVRIAVHRRGATISSGNPANKYMEQFYVLPKAGELKPLRLDDILLPQQRGRLEKLLTEKFRQGLMAPSCSALTAQELKENAAAFPFKVFPLTASDNWYFYERGLRFHYDLAPDFTCMPILLVPTAQLKDMVKPEILQELASWQESKPIRDAAEYQITAKPQWRGADE